MIRKIRNNLPFFKIRTQLILLILCAGIISMLLFRFLWTNKHKAWRMATQIEVFHFPSLREDFFTKLYEQTLKYNVPSNEKNKKEQKDFQSFFDLLDDYTGIYIYGAEDGIYRTGKFPEYLSRASHNFLWLNVNNDLDYLGEESLTLALKFKNGYYSVMIDCYHQTQFFIPYYFFCFILSVLIFVSFILIFVNQKMRFVIKLEKDILQIASGDLNHPISIRGKDEIGSLATELDHLRLAFQENIMQEQESRKANQDLITALSHDLRTPLTILNGYLEVLLLRRNPKMQEEYLSRCLKKTKDIRELTDRMFEYSLVSEEQEIPELTWLSTDFAEQCLNENCDFIKLAGFTVNLTLPSITGVFLSDRTMLKRIFNNLFSNIIKYGDKKTPINVTGKIEKKNFYISIKNTVKQEFSPTTSNNIGLKTVRKIMYLLNGNLSVEVDQDTFIVDLKFSLK